LKHRRKFAACGTFLAVALYSAGCGPPAGLPDDGFVDVTGGRIAFRVMGDGAGVPVLVIHGGPGSSSCIYPSTLTGMAEERPVIMYDQLGTGHSERITDLERYAVLPRFVEEVTALRAELGLEELHILGHSWGATVALEYLLTASPTGVLSVTLVGPLVGTDRWLRDANDLVAELSVEAQAAVRAAVDSGDFATAAFEAANTEFMGQFGIRNPDAYAGIQECALRPPGNSGLYEYMWGPSEFVSTGTLRDYDRIDRLPELTLPVLFLVGEYDEARPETVREFQAMVPGSIVRVQCRRERILGGSRTSVAHERDSAQQASGAAPGEGVGTATRLWTGWPCSKPRDIRHPAEDALHYEERLHALGGEGRPSTADVVCLSGIWLESICLL
jgi:proline iminopeptidase